MISYRSRLGLSIAIVFLGIVFILATTQAGSLLGAWFMHIRPLDYLRPTLTTPKPASSSLPFSSPTATSPTIFRQAPQAPPSFTHTPESILKDAKDLCAKSRQVIDRIVSEVTPETATFENVILPMALHGNEDTLQSRILGFYQYVSIDASLRNASSNAEQILVDYSIEAGLREDIYRLVEAVFERGEKLDTESQRLLEKERKDYISAGLGIEVGEKRNRFKEVQKHLSQLSIQFSKNLNEETGGVWFTENELDGVPKKVLDGFESGTGERAGSMRMTFKYPDYVPVMKYAKLNETRFKVLLAHENNMNINIPIFKEIMILRDEAARLLGYHDHASYRIEDKMAKNPQTVWDFLLDLKSRLAPHRKEELQHLLDVKKSELEGRVPSEAFDGNYYSWDHQFYSRKMLEDEFSIDSQEVAEYFPLISVIENMFRIFEKLFGLKFVELSTDNQAKITVKGQGKGQGNDMLWHSDVRAFQVWDDGEEGGEFVGHLYLDLHPRPGKYGHAANFGLQPGFLFENGTRHYPATALVCNFPEPSEASPSLLQHSEVTTLFHELGHGIHDLVSRTRFSRFHGTSTVQDFVEAPSQMLENWCWTPSQLKLLSEHYLSGEPMSDDLIANLVKTKHVNGAISNLRQLHVGIYDMTIHTPETHKHIEETKFSELYNDLKAEISGLKGPEALGLDNAWGNGQCTFGHLISGYDAGYYGYLASQVYSADMFHTVFEKDPTSSQEGRRYRHMVLEKGGSQDEMKVLEAFLGRKPNTDAFYQELG